MRRLAVLLAACALAGCTKTVALSGAIAPASIPPERSSEKAGVVCSAGLLELVERASPRTLAGMATTYALALGEPLCAALVRSTEGSFRSVTRTAKPYKGQYARVVRFDVQTSGLSIERLPNGEMRVHYTLSVAVERLDRDLRQLGRNVVTGNRLVDCARVDDEAVRQAVESALQQVADGASSLLVARLDDGPRVRGKLAP